MRVGCKSAQRKHVGFSLFIVINDRVQCKQKCRFPDIHDFREIV